MDRKIQASDGSQNNLDSQYLREMAPFGFNSQTSRTIFMRAGIEIFDKRQGRSGFADAAPRDTVTIRLVASSETM